MASRYASLLEVTVVSCSVQSQLQLGAKREKGKVVSRSLSGQSQSQGKGKREKGKVVSRSGQSQSQSQLQLGAKREKGKVFSGEWVVVSYLFSVVCYQC